MPLLKTIENNLKKLLTLLLLALALVSVVYIYLRTQSAVGGIDFHQFWYSGFFIRQGTDPYQAFLEGQTPELPIVFFDHSKTDENPVQSDLAQVPSITAPLILLLSVFSNFPWPLAKSLWMVFNYLFLLLIPALVIRMHPGPEKIPARDQVIFHLLFLCLFGARNSATNGQTSLFIFLCVLAAILLANRNAWLLSGVLFGFALSKYSLSAPVFLFMKYRNKGRVMATGLVVQALGVAAIALISGESVIDIIAAYFRIMTMHLGYEGIHLTSLFADSIPAAILALLILTGVLAIAGYRTYFQGRNQSSVSNKPDAALREPIFLLMIMIWTLLLAYHRAYDSFIVILFLFLGARIMGQSGAVHRRRLAAGLALTIVVFTLPASGVQLLGGLLGGMLDEGSIRNWISLHNKVISVALLAIFGYVSWIFFTFRNRTETQRMRTG